MSNSDNRLYGDGSSPTAEQIIQAVVCYKGECIKFIRCCIAASRGGDDCPLYSIQTGCKGELNPYKRLRLARKWLMEKVDT